MSLDIYLTLPGAQAAPGSGIFIRDNGGRREISRDEWDDLYPGLEPVVCAYESHSDEVYSANITHNLGKWLKRQGYISRSGDQRNWALLTQQN